METSISLADLINKDRLRAFVEEVSYLAAVPILVLDAGGEMLAKAGQLPTECPWLEEGFKIESTGSVVDLCTPRNCPFSRNQVCIPIEIQGNVVGHILSCSDSGNNRDNMGTAAKIVNNDVTSKAYSEFELNSLSMEILDRYEEINLLYDIGESLGAVFDANTIYEIVLEKGTEVIGAEKAWIMILDKEGEKLHLAAVKGLSGAGMTGLTIKVGEGISGKVIQEGKPVLIEEAPQLPIDLLCRGEGSEAASFASLPMMAVPLKVKEKVLGVMNMAEKRSQQMFTAGDLKLLSAIASQSAISIHNSQLVEDLKESERVKRDMEIAERIQMSLLPKIPPRFAGVELAGKCVPAKNVGGDYYDFFTISDDELSIVIADVSGHSVGAALVMASARSTLRSEILQNSDPSVVLAKTNAVMYSDLTASELFITMFNIKYNRRTRVLTYANGGHNLPFIYRARDGQCVTIDTEGMLIGMLENINFDQGLMKLDAGDILVLYTDGITEAANGAGEQFGEERLYRIVKQNSNVMAQELAEEIYRQVHQYSEDVVQYDDITMVVMKIIGEPIVE